MSIKYFFNYKIINFIGKFIKNEKTQWKITLINFSKSYDWLNNGARVKTSKIWAPVYWQPVVLELSPLGD